MCLAIKLNTQIIGLVSKKKAQFLTYLLTWHRLSLISSLPCQQLLHLWHQGASVNHTFLDELEMKVNAVSGLCLASWLYSNSIN